MQQKRSVNKDDWKQAYKDGFDGFVLQCGAETGKGYIDEFSQLTEVKNAFYRSDGVHVAFKREKPEVIKSINSSDKVFTLKQVIIICSIWLVGFVGMIAISYLTDHQEPAPIIEQPKTVIVQNNIVPRDCYMIHTKLEVGYSIMIISVDNPEARFYIEVEDYDKFFNEYISKKQ